MASRDAHHAARSGVVQVLTAVAQTLAGVTHVLLARLFGAAVFGSYQTAAAILEMITRAGTGGADKSMLRYVAAYRARGEPDLVRSALGTGLRLAFGTAAVLATALAACAPLVGRIAHEASLATALPLMAPAAVFTGCMFVLVQASLASKVTHGNFIVRGLAEPTLLLCAGLLAALVGRTVAHLAVAQVAASAATLTLAVVVVSRVFGRGELGRAVRAPRLPGFVSASLPIGAAELTNAILQRADIVLLTGFVGPSSAAVYVAAEFLTRIIGNARSAFDSIAAPIFSEALHLEQRERFRANLQMMVRWVASAAAPIAVTVIALRHELLSLYGAGFIAGATTMVVLTVSHVINATLGLSGYVLVVGGRTRLLLLNNVVGAVANVGLALFMIPRFGIVGAAISSLIGTSLFHVMLAAEVYLLHRVFAFQWALLKPFGAALGALAVELALGRLPLPVAAKIPLVIVVGLAAYLGALVALGLAAEERRVLLSALDRVKRWLRRGRR
jgi:O-antigen/teichoic acid export membrane protein